MKLNKHMPVAFASTFAILSAAIVTAPDAVAKKKPAPPAECAVDTNIRTADPALLKRLGMVLEGCEDQLLVAPADPSEYEDPENISIAVEDTPAVGESEYAYDGKKPAEEAKTQFADLDKVNVAKTPNDKAEKGNRIFYYSKTGRPAKIAGTGAAVVIVSNAQDQDVAAVPRGAPSSPPARGEAAIFNMRPHNYQTRYDELIAQAAKRHRIDPLLLHAVIKQESGYRSKAVSHAGAAGLMQLMPATGRGLGVRPNERFDPAKNIDAGARLLRRLWFKYDGNIDLMLAAYNAGEGAVAKYGNKVPPYRETKNYVRSINAHYQRLLAKQRPEALQR